MPGYTNSIYKTANGDGVIFLEDDNVHQIKIAVKDVNGNTSLVQFNVKTWAGGVVSKIKKDSSGFL
ncbi:MAG: hypothetical protein WDM90_20280 [Ferruginibacter sp.]